MKPFLPNERSRCAPQVRIIRSISAQFRRPRRRRRGLGPGMLQLDGIQQLRHRRADRGPVRLGIVARPDQRLAQRLQPLFVAQFDKPGPAQQRPQRRIAQRGLVEFGQMRVAAGVVPEQGIADIVKRRAVLPGRQRAVGGPGDVLKLHRISFRAIGPPVPARPRPATAVASAVSNPCKSLKNYTNAREIQT